VTSIGIDPCAVDYELLRGGALLADPFRYRHPRTPVGVPAVHAVIPQRELYARGGLQFLPFNTLYQLTADRLAGLFDGPAAAERMLLIPDLVAHLLTGQARAESTNSSTTGLLTRDHEWDWELIDLIGLPRRLFAPLITPGETVGGLNAESVAALGFSAPVTAVASHDTASAVLATPLAGDDAVYISCGTWGLVGLETEEPIVTEASRVANFTNEGGAFGTTRFLRNVMGLWLLNESVAAWRSRGEAVELPALLTAAAGIEGTVTVFDVDDPRFSAPGDMPTRIETHCRENGLSVPSNPVEMVRSIVESLAVAFARAAHQAADLAGREIGVIHMVGGGALNALLCQRIADQSGLPLVAGPVEATALGNVLMQAKSAGALSADLPTIRNLVARHTALRRYTPTAERR
jgi:rhamnulokinase